MTLVAETIHSDLKVSAERELAAFLFVVHETFGNDEMPRAADLWITNFEATGNIDADAAQVVRDVTIHATAQFYTSRKNEALS
jgi:hypothetical protein